ncbi:helix-turn-helix domain-containing protein [Amycolatopsis suaedae]|uniref:XRE family transcriptional regulator n=1 Tax=Amycolatopsis suaedae TaxID=2510978 RepID=A0A4Q7J599_9PSEU|nr:helix-turn-helix domain-containing protein [Amycolatopsis suaedae]RZQ62257.1 XRE family transcriptional regulator [Amycolatopsis suaedae]
MANERLRGCISASGLTIEAVAARIGVNQKTVERWISTGRLPHRGHRWKAATLLGQDETYLWPELQKDPQVQLASQAEFVQLFPHRGAVPHDMWKKLVDDLTDGLDILVYSGLFLLDTRPDITEVLATKAVDGARIRILFGDPESDEVIRRSEEEGIGRAGLPGRINTSLSYLSKVTEVPGIEVRLHSTILYNSIYRSDSTMLVNPHVYGFGAPFNPVMHLQRVPGGRMFDHYQESFERVWETGKPYEATR